MKNKINFLRFRQLLCIFTFPMMFMSNSLTYSQGAAINTSGLSANSSAMLDVSATDKGLLPPRLSTSQMNAIASPAAGLFIYNTDCNNFYYYNGTTWGPINDITAGISISATPAGSICSGTSVTFTSSSVNPGTMPQYQWKKNGVTISAATNSSYTTSALTNGDQISCELTSNASCVSGSPATSNTITAVVNDLPTTSNAGADQNFVGTSVTLSANTPTIGTGLWSIISGAGGTITTPSNPSSTFTGTANTSYVLEWTITNANCTSSDLVTINFLPCTVGAPGGGGIVFYNGGTGKCLIAPTSDQSASSSWGCYGTTIAGADGTAIGTGAQNTTDIIAGCTTSGIAAKICRSYSGDGYTDWFLPSQDELNQMYIQKNTVGGFSNSYYWSSSEYNNLYAWLQDFQTGSTGYSEKNGTAVRLRCIRAF